MKQELSVNDVCLDYSKRLQSVLETSDWSAVSMLAMDMESCWKSGRQVFFCGNGGSAGNAIHLANDFVYGIAKKHGAGMKATALPANQSVLTCLANDVGYDDIFSEQLAVFAKAGLRPPPHGDQPSVPKRSALGVGPLENVPGGLAPRGGSSSIRTGHGYPAHRADVPAVYERHAGGRFLSMVGVL